MAEGLRTDWLTAFLAVVDEGTYSCAAKALGSSQPTVSRHVDQLEQWLGGKLLSDEIPPVLTPQGELFEPVARSMLEKLEATRMMLEAMERNTALFNEMDAALTAKKKAEKLERKKKPQESGRGIFFKKR